MRFLLLVLALPLLGQSTNKTVTLTWDDTLNPVGTTYNIYRASGPCSGAPTFVKIGSEPSKSYSDLLVPIGKYCYAVTSVLQDMESGFSNTAEAKVTPAPPKNVQTSVAMAGGYIAGNGILVTIK